VAFYGLLALFPAIAALISIWALAFDPLQIEQQIEGLSALLPPDAAGIVKEQAHNVAANVSGLSVGAAVGILLALYSAAKGMKALIEGLNIIYDEQEERGFIRLNLVALGLMLAVIVAIIVAIGAIVLVPVLLNTTDSGRSRRPCLDCCAGRSCSGSRWLFSRSSTVMGRAARRRAGGGSAGARPSRPPSGRSAPSRSRSTSRTSAATTRPTARSAPSSSC
jgi:hypothetical protein